MKSLILKVFLWTAMTAGLAAGMWVSYRTVTNIAPCPDIVMGIPACYVVLLAYLSMMIVTYLKRSRISNLLFGLGWLVVFGFAVLGSAAEFMQGHVCPRLGENIPLCYASLFLSIVIIASHLLLKRQVTYVVVD